MVPRFLLLLAVLAVLGSSDALTRFRFFEKSGCDVPPARDWTAADGSCTQRGSTGVYYKAVCSGGGSINFYYGCSADCTSCSGPVTRQSGSCSTLPNEAANRLIIDCGYIPQNRVRLWPIPNCIGTPSVTLVNNNTMCTRRPLGGEILDSVSCSGQGNFSAALKCTSNCTTGATCGLRMTGNAGQCLPAGLGQSMWVDCGLPEPGACQPYAVIAGGGVQTIGKTPRFQWFMANLMNGACAGGAASWTWSSTGATPFAFTSAQSQGPNALTVDTNLLVGGATYMVQGMATLMAGGTVFAPLSITVRAVKPMAMVAGGGQLVVGNGDAFKLDGSGSMNPNLPGGGYIGLNFKWTCVNREGFGCADYAAGLAANATVMALTATSLPNARKVMEFTLIVCAPGPVCSDPVRLVLTILPTSDGKVPVVTIRQVGGNPDNPWVVSASQPVGLVADGADRVAKVWTCVSGSTGAIVPLGASSSGIRGPWLWIPPNTLGPDTYMFTVTTVASPDFASTFSAANVTVTGPPSGGAITVTPDVAGSYVAFNSTFTITASGWTSGTGSTLMYQFFLQFALWAGQNVVRIPLTPYPSASNVFEGVLPSPRPDSSAHVKVGVKVIDTFGGVGSATQDVTLTKYYADIGTSIGAMAQDAMNIPVDSLGSAMAMLTRIGCLFDSVNSDQRLLTPAMRLEVGQARRNMVNRSLEVLTQYPATNREAVATLSMSMYQAVQDVSGQDSLLRETAIMVLRKAFEGNEDVNLDATALQSAAGVLGSVLQGWALNGTRYPKEKVEIALRLVIGGALKGIDMRGVTTNIDGESIGMAAYRVPVDAAASNVTLEPRVSSLVVNPRVIVPAELFAMVPADAIVHIAGFSTHVYPSLERRIAHGCSVSVAFENSTEVPVAGLSAHPFLVYLPKNGTSTRPACVFWDPVTNAWSTQGVMLVEATATHFICRSTHLSDFAVTTTDTTDPASSASSSSTDSLPLILGLVVGGVVLVAIVGVIIGIIMRRARVHPDKAVKLSRMP